MLLLEYQFTGDRGEELLMIYWERWITILTVTDSPAMEFLENNPTQKPKISLRSMPLFQGVGMSDCNAESSVRFCGGGAHHDPSIAGLQWTARNL
jgi:hypothetical protein